MICTAIRRGRGPASLLTVPALLTVLALLAGAVGCGQPSYTYVKDAADHTYFRVPASFHHVKQSDVNRAMAVAEEDSATLQLQRALTWHEAYDADDIATAVHVFTPEVTDQPVVYAKVVRVLPTERDIVSLDYLRDAMAPPLFPVTDARRDHATDTLLENGRVLPRFELLSDRPITPSASIHGVRVIYNYSLGGVVHTFDLTALVDNALSKIYVLLIRCSARCYNKRASELNAIAESFTVRSP